MSKVEVFLKNKETRRLEVAVRDVSSGLFLFNDGSVREPSDVWDKYKMATNREANRMKRRQNRDPHSYIKTHLIRFEEERSGERRKLIGTSRLSGEKFKSWAFIGEYKEDAVNHIVSEYHYKHFVK